MSTVSAVPAVGRQLRAIRLAVLLGSLALGLLMVFVAFRAQTVVVQTDDLYRFAEYGRNLAEGRGLSLDGGHPSMRRGPGYPAFTALIYLVFGPNHLFILVIQALLAAGTCLLVFELGRLVFSVRVGLLAALITAFHPMVMRYVPDIQVETLLSFLFTLTVYCSVRFVIAPSLLNGFFLGAASACAAHVKGVVVPYPGLFAVAFVLYRYLSQRDIKAVLGTWKSLAMIFVAMALLILPWTYRNYALSGHFVLISSNAGGEFLRGYVFAQPKYYLLEKLPYIDGETEANEMQRQLFRSKGLVWERDEAETDQVQNKAAKEKLSSDPAAFLRKVSIGVFTFWYEVTTRKNSIVIGLLALAGWALTLFGLVRGRPKKQLFWFLLLPIVSVNLIYAAVLALGRYSAPCIPTLMVMAAYGLTVLLPLERLFPQSIALAER